MGDTGSEAACLRHTRVPVKCIIEFWARYNKNRMGQCAGATTLVNSFSLVAYLPEPLASFIDRLRRDMAAWLHGPRARIAVASVGPIDDPLEQACSRNRSGHSR